MYTGVGWIKVWRHRGDALESVTIRRGNKQRAYVKGLTDASKNRLETLAIHKEGATIRPFRLKGSIGWVAEWKEDVDEGA